MVLWDHQWLVHRSLFQAFCAFDPDVNPDIFVSAIVHPYESCVYDTVEKSYKQGTHDRYECVCTCIMKEYEDTKCATRRVL